MTMTNRENLKRDGFILSTLDELVPQDHMVRKLEDSIDWTFIYPLVKNLYSPFGRPSIDPVVLFKMIFINYTFGYNSMRKTCEEIEVNLAYRWFLGYSIDEPVPNYSTWSQNYIRRYGDSNVFDQIFETILAEAIKYDFVRLETVFGDGTHMKACANRHKSVRAEVEITKRAYEEQLLEEINEDRRAHGKKKEFQSLTRSELAFDETTGEQIEVIKKKTIKQSVTDPEAGNFHKGEHEGCFAYELQTFCDRNGFVLSFDAVPGNMHDSVSFFSAYSKLKERFQGQIKYLCLDAGYKTPSIAREIIRHGQVPVFPYKRPMTKDGFYKKQEYVYDEEFDCYICPNNKILKYSTTNRLGYKEYKSDRRVCESCPFVDRCTKSKNHTKVVTRHVWEEYMEEAEDFRHTPEYKKIYPLRKQTIERVFADVKENHGMRYTRERGLQKNRHRASIIFACHNLSRIGKWKWQKSSGPHRKTMGTVLHREIVVINGEIAMIKAVLLNEVTALSTI